MTFDLHNLIEALREELQQYGEMLALLDQQQQEWVTPRGGDGLGDSLGLIRAQSATIQAARQRRQKLQRELAHALQLPAGSSLTELIPLLQDHYRPLLSALVQENHELLQRIGHRAQQIQGMLQQSQELMQSFLDTLSPSDLAPASVRSAASLLEAAPNPACCEAVA